MSADRAGAPAGGGEPETASGAPAAGNRVARLLFALAVAPWLLAAACRTWRLLGSRRLEEAAARLRRPAVALPRFLRRPGQLAALVERLLPFVPPRRCGICLRRSALLLDLWARCGLDPRLHLGVRGAAGDPEGHAWVTAGPWASSRLDFPEAFRF